MSTILCPCSVFWTKMLVLILENDYTVYNIGAPSIRKEVHFDVRVPGSSILSAGQVFGLQHVHNQLMANFIIPHFHLQEMQA